MSSGTHNLVYNFAYAYLCRECEREQENVQVWYHTQKNVQVQYISYSLFQHSAGVQKPNHTHTHCATKNLVKKKEL